MQSAFSTSGPSSGVRMRRRQILLAVGGAFGGTLRGVAGSPPTGDASRPTGTSDCTFRNPIFEEFVVPDPSVLRTPGGTYYAYATYNVWGDDDDRPLVPVLQSPDLVDWTFVGAAFEERPAWKGGGLWAPDATRRCGQYLLYYSLACWGDSNPGIGVAASAAPVGPFEDRGPLLRSGDVGVPNSIDPHLVVDGGTPYLLWGSHQGIYGVRLATDGLSLAGELFRVAGEGVEAAALLRREGRYFLFVSTGTCCEGAESTYRVLVGRASSLEGPYVDRAGHELAAGHGVTVVRGNGRFVAPGHADVVRDDSGEAWLVHHAYERSKPWAGETPRRILLLSPLDWRDGWPVVPGRTPPVAATCPESTV